MQHNYRAGYFPCSPPDPLSTLLCGPSQWMTLTRPPWPLASCWVQPMGGPAGGQRAGGDRAWGSCSSCSFSAGQRCGHSSSPRLKVTGWGDSYSYGPPDPGGCSSPCHSRPRKVSGQWLVPGCPVIPCCSFTACVLAVHSALITHPFGVRHHLFPVQTLADIVTFTVLFRVSL